MSDADSTFKRLIATVADGKSLSESEAVEAFNIMMSGEATPSQIAGFLIALRIREFGAQSGSQQFAMAWPRRTS